MRYNYLSSLYTTPIENIFAFLNQITLGLSLRRQPFFSAGNTEAIHPLRFNVYRLIQQSDLVHVVRMDEDLSRLAIEVTADQASFQQLVKPGLTHTQHLDRHVHTDRESLVGFVSRRHFLGPSRRSAVRRRAEPIAQGPTRRRDRRRARFRRAQRVHSCVPVLVGDDAGEMAGRAQRPSYVSGRRCTGLSDVFSAGRY